MFMYCPFGRETGIWAESSEKWDDAYPCWKIVGNSPRRVLRSDLQVQDHDAFHRSSIEHIFEYDRLFYTVVFSSGRTSTVASRSPIAAGTYVIIEADRGEDCARVQERLWVASEEAKGVLRKATPHDIETLEQRKIHETRAQEKCSALVEEKQLPIEVTGCEFQWDMKKITFYFKSDRRVDFRELVKDLFKFYRIRIWMSMENRRL